MAKGNIPKWLEEVEEILRKQLPRPELSFQIRRARELIGLIPEVEMPSGDTGKVVAIILRLASEELGPLPSVYAGFQLGTAYERLQNANRA